MVDYAAAEWERRGRTMRVIDSGGMAAGVGMPIRFTGSLLRIASACLRGQVGLLHVHVAAYGSVARKAPFVLLGRGFGLPVVLHMHGADFEAFHERLGSVGRRVVRAVFRAASAVVVLGSRGRAHTIARVGVDARRIHVLANAVPDFPRTERNETGCCRLLFLGALTERKGLPELLEALASPTLADADWRLDLVGNGDEAFWREAAARLGLAERVRFLGWLPSERAREMLAGADLLVLPSRQEGLPMAILEAMAAGVAVLATDVGDVAEAVVSGRTGALVSSRDPNALADALSRLIGSRALRDRLGDAGRARFEARFGIGAYSDRLASIFDRAAVEATRHRTLWTRARTETP